MKRVLTKIAAIIGTVLYGLMAAGCSLLFGLILSNSALLSKITGLNLHRVFMAVLVIIVFIIAVVGLVFSIKAISFSRESLDVYRNKYPILITSVVFNSMFAILLILFLGAPSLLDITIFGCFIAGGILYTVDMARNTILLEKLEKQGDSAEQQEDEDDENINSNSLESQLKKLNELKDQNLITEKELNALREKLVKQEIEKE